MSSHSNKMNIDPKMIMGNWTHGWALDQHTLRSTSGGSDSSMHPEFDTERTELGEALYKLKYRADLAQVEPIARTVADFIRSRSELSDIKAVLAVPPSDTRRSFQPVQALTAGIGALLRLPAPDDYLLKSRATLPLKSVTGKHSRRLELDGAFDVADQRFADMHVLLFDDLFRSGETLKAVTATLLFQGNAAMVSVVTATSTRSHR
ncbi:MAG: ComF family protein [Candidatus Aminicenantes bacterium]|nr:ComF family protein [Candidatus Aminicenantes bacterium]